MHFLLRILLVLGFLGIGKSSIFYDDTQVFWYFCWQAYYQPSQILDQLFLQHRDNYERMFGVDTKCANHSRSFEEEEEKGSLEESRQLYYDPVTFDVYLYFTVPFVVPIYNQGYVGSTFRDFGLADDAQSDCFDVDDGHDSSNLIEELELEENNEDWFTILEDIFEGSFGVVSAPDGEWKAESPNPIHDSQVEVLDEDYIRGRDGIFPDPTQIADTSTEGLTVEVIEDYYLSDQEDIFSELTQTVDDDSDEARVEVLEDHHYDDHPVEFQNSTSTTANKEIPESRRTIFHQDSQVVFFFVIFFWAHDSFEDIFWAYMDAVSKRSAHELSFLNFLSQLNRTFGCR